MTGSKVKKGFPAKEVSGQAVSFGGGKIVSDGADFFSEIIRKDFREVIRIKH